LGVAPVPQPLTRMISSWQSYLRSWTTFRRMKDGMELGKFSCWFMSRVYFFSDNRWKFNIWNLICLLDHNMIDHGHMVEYGDHLIQEITSIKSGLVSIFSDHGSMWRA
jgi:hypothetical protein